MCAQASLVTSTHCLYVCAFLNNSMASLDGLFSNQEVLLKPCAKQHVDMINTLISICFMHPYTFQEVIEITVCLFIYFLLTLKVDLSVLSLHPVVCVYV